MYDCKAPLSRFYYPDTRRIINAFIIIIILLCITQHGHWHCHVTLSYLIMLTGYQMETDCDTVTNTVTDNVTSSWSCDEVPSVLSHSPGSAIVQQIPILDVTYTEEQCLRKTGSFIAITCLMFNFRFSVFCHFGDVDILKLHTCMGSPVSDAHFGDFCSSNTIPCLYMDSG